MKKVKENTIEIQEEVKIGNVILEKGDKIEVIVDDKESLKEANTIIDVSLRGNEEIEDVIRKTMVEAGPFLGITNIDLAEIEIMGSPKYSNSRNILFGSIMITQEFLFGGKLCSFNLYIPIGVFAKSKNERKWVTMRNKSVDVNFITR